MKVTRPKEFVKNVMEEVGPIFKKYISIRCNMRSFWVLRGFTALGVNTVVAAKKPNYECRTG